MTQKAAHAFTGLQGAATAALMGLLGLAAIWWGIKQSQNAIMGCVVG